MPKRKQLEGATKRIPLKPSTFERFRDFCNGIDLKYDEVLNELLDDVILDGEEPLFAGFRLRIERQRKSLKSKS